MKLFLAVPINIYDLRMDGFSTETAVFLQTLRYNVLNCVANAIYAQIIHMITCSEVFAKSPAFLDSILVYSGHIKIMSSGTAEKILFWGSCSSFTNGKTYLVIQTLRIVKWFRYPCYVNCVPTTELNLSLSIFGGRRGILA